MTWKALLQIVKDLLLQNTSADFFDDSYFLYALNRGLDYVFDELTMTGAFWYAFHEETLTVTNGEAEATYPIFRVVQDLDVGETGVSITAGNNPISKDTQLRPKNFYRTFTGSVSENYYYTLSGTKEKGRNKILVDSSISEIKVRYFRWPVHITQDDFDSYIVDLPNDSALDILKYQLLYQTLPMYMNEGASLSSYAFNQMEQILKKYKTRLTFGTDEQQFTAVR